MRNDQPDQIGALWEQFYRSNLREQVANAASPDIYCVYSSYAGDQTDPYDMTIGYRVSDGASCPGGLSRVDIPRQTFAVFEATGPQPQTLLSQWQAIWQGTLDRAFAADFDVHDASKQDRVTVYVGLKGR